VILAVIAHSSKARELRSELIRRFGGDYVVHVAASVALASAMLSRLRDESRDIALILADFELSPGTGIEFLAQVHAHHPEAKRALLSRIGHHEAAAPIHRAMALGEIDLVIYWPWESPEESLYPLVSESLGAWWRTHRRLFERIQIVGEQWDTRSHELRDLGTRNGVPFGFYPADTLTGRRILRKLNLDGSSLPVVIVDGQVLIDPSIIEIANVLSATTKPPTDLCDVAIIGAGPAGLAAALSAASEGLRTVVIEPEALGGQAGTSSMIRNYLGFPRGISGEEITKRAHEQALHFGAEIVHTHAAVGLRTEGDTRIVTLSNGSELLSRTVVLATGVSYRRLEVPALERLIGAGVFYGAATSEARALADEEVLVVGAGNSAGQAAQHLAQFAKQVTLIVRGNSLVSSMSTYLIRQIRNTPNIKVRLRTRVVDGHGDHHLEGLVLQDDAGRRVDVEARALFVLIGGQPRTGWLAGQLARDSGEYIITCRDLDSDYTSILADWPLDRSPFPMETSMPGVFAVGDVRHNSIKRVASAVGEGSVSISAIHAYLKDLRRSGRLSEGRPQPRTALALVGA
jgi:thioredoxin reductase (NADPH)